MYKRQELLSSSEIKIVTNINKAKKASTLKPPAINTNFNLSTIIGAHAFRGGAGASFGASVFYDLKGVCVAHASLGIVLFQLPDGNAGVARSVSVDDRVPVVDPFSIERTQMFGFVDAILGFSYSVACLYT